MGGTNTWSTVERGVCTQFLFGLWLISSGWAPKSPLSLTIREAGPGGCRRSVTRLRSCWPQAWRSHEGRAGPGSSHLPFQTFPGSQPLALGPHRTVSQDLASLSASSSCPLCRPPGHCPGSARCWPCDVHGAKGQATCPEGSGTAHQGEEPEMPPSPRLETGQHSRYGWHLLVSREGTHTLMGWGFHGEGTHTLAGWDLQGHKGDARSGRARDSEARMLLMPAVPGSGGSQGQGTSRW